MSLQPADEKLVKKFKKKHKVALCLSGGGTRGFSYLGAFKAFEDYNVKFDAVAGTSAGSLFGALYASGLKYEDMYKLTYSVKNKDFRHSKLGFLPSDLDGLENLIKRSLPVSRIEQLNMPFFAVAVDLKTGKEIHFASGDLSKVIAGSCSIPGVFLPVKYKNMMLIDGGVTNNIPADVLKDGGYDYVVTIDCNCSRGGGTNSKNIFAQFRASVGIMMASNSKNGKMLSDIAICPNLQNFKSLNIAGKNEMIKEGYRATVEAMPEIIKLFTGKYKNSTSNPVQFSTKSNKHKK